MRTTYLWIVIAAAGCSSGAPAPPRPTGSVGVGQGGPQDIARFRGIVEAGEVPAPETLDPTGFLAEHAFDLPPADCGEVVCAHPFLAVAPRFDGSNWTMAFVALNSAVDPSSFARPPIHVALAVERTTRVGATEADLRTAVRALVLALRPEDRVTLIRVGEQASVLGEALAPDDVALGDAIDALTGAASDSTAATYDALALAQSALEGFSGQRRVVLVTTGQADGGVASEARTIELAREMAQRQTTLSIVGMGERYADRLPLALGELGAGAYYFAQDGADLLEILRIEGQTALFPLATGFTLSLQPAPGYRIGRVVGARIAAESVDGVTISAPVLLLGQREGATDVDRGRRGGGGGVFVELVADPSAGIAAGQPAYSIVMRYTDASTAGVVEQRASVMNELAPGQNPAMVWPSFSDPGRGKPFMVLNMYLALRGAIDFYEAGDCARAMGIADMMRRSVEAWQARYGDPDIDEDWGLLLELRANVQARCNGGRSVTPIEPINWREASCMWS